MEQVKRLICFGDSITAREIFENKALRLTPRLQNAFPEWEILNAGISGNNTYDALKRLEEDVLSYQPSFVIVFFGANDAAFHKQIPLQEYRENIIEIVERISPYKVLLISPAPVDEERQYARTNAVLKQYAEVVSDVAARTGSNSLDLYTSIIQLPNYKLLLENEKQDGLHFGVHGYEYLAEVIIEKIKEIKW
ncbi:SGNH/GDSL hydrolase family protein [Bacillus thuringiensis]